MNRHEFLKLAALGGLGLNFHPQLIVTDFSEEISYEELIGKGKPELFGDGYKLRKPANEAFLQMASEAKKSEINIQVVSSYRSFVRQNQIWERKFKSNENKGLKPTENIQKIIEYSTIPGTSRHHWGTDLDIIDGNVKQPSSVLQSRHFEANGCYRKLKLWMDEHANRFGFYLVYTNLETRKGFKYEPWHYSYKPLSQTYLKQYQMLDLKKIILKEQLMGSASFSEAFMNLYCNEHILDINPELL